MSDQHLQLHTSGHLQLHSSGHLMLKHPGYTVADFALGGRYYGENSGVAELPWQDPDGNIVARIKPYISTSIGASISAMSLSGTSASAEIAGGYNYGGGQNYPFWSSARSGGLIKSVAANSGADFGAPTCSLLVTVTASTQGSAGSPLVLVGSGTSAPSGNPSGWSYSNVVSATSTLTDFALGAYVWCGCWFTSPTSVTSSSISRTLSASLTFSNITYHSA